MVDDPDAMTRLIIKAITLSGQRALVSKGWGGFGVADGLEIPDSILMIDDVPHNWLFPRVTCVVHHGGAGTTAAGVLYGKPTVIVPFFADQPFWGSIVQRAGIGPAPIPIKSLTADSLANAIVEALHPSVLRRAKDVSLRMAAETGTETGALCFHKHLKMSELRCSLAPDRAAVWRVRRTAIRLSALTAAVLLDAGLLNLEGIKL